MKKNLKQTLWITLIFIVYILLDIFLYRHLYRVSNKFAKFMQSKDNLIFQSVMVVVAQFGNEFVLGVIVAFLWLVSGNKIQIFKLVTMVGVSGYLVAVLKIIYKQPRPFFIEPNIKSFECGVDFGNPSGHALACLIIYKILFDTIVFNKYNAKEENIVPQELSPSPDGESNAVMKQVVETIADKSSLNKNQLYEAQQPNTIFTLYQKQIILYLFIFVIGLSRVYLGSHSLNQILLGYLFGGYVLYIYYFAFEQLLDRIITTAIYKKFNDQKDKVKFLGYIVLFYLFTNFLAIILFVLREYYDDQLKADEVDWQINIEQQCGPVTKYLKFQRKLLVDSGVINLPIFLLLSLLMCKGSYKPSKYPKKISFQLHIQRLLAIILTAALLFLTIYLITTQTSLKKNAISVFFMQNTLGIGLFSIGFICIVPKVFNCFNLDVPGDLLRVKEQDLEL